MRRAVEFGVNFVDTSPSYQLAEERIGKSGIAQISGVIVSTKCGHVLDRGVVMSDADLARAVTLEVEASLQKIGVDHFDLVQVHGGTAKQIRDGSIIKPINALKATGKLRFAGISIRDEAAALAAIESGFFDTLQVAYSILDQRLAPAIIEAAKQKNIGLVNRSVLLKGVLTPAAEYLFAALAPLKQNARKAEDIAQRLGIDLPTLAIRFALSEPAVGTVLIGSNKISHLEHALKAANQGALPAEVILELRSLAINDENQIDPRRWKAQATAKELATWSDGQAKPR